MAICTYLNEWEFKNFTTVKDNDMNELFQEIRSIFKDQYYIQEHEYFVKRWFKKPKVRTVYTLYKMLSMPEVQVVNFFIEGKSTINTNPSKALIMATFYGLINGYHYSKSFSHGK